MAAASSTTKPFNNRDWEQLILSSIPRSDDLDAWKAHFESVARFLLLECTLVIDHCNYFRINEIEFYYHGELHPDVFTHQHPNQRSTGTWYFHSSGASYRGGTFKGLDLTCGLPGSDHAAGILLRGMIREDSPGHLASPTQIIQGSCLLVDQILKVAEIESIKEFVDERLDSNLSVFDTSSPLHLIRHARPRSDEVYRSSRVGLFLKKKDVPMSEQHRFVAQPYRFVTAPLTVAKGRAQLFAGIAMDKSVTEASKLVKGTPALLSKYRAAYETALKTRDDVLDKDRARRRYEGKSLDEIGALEMFVVFV